MKRVVEITTILISIDQIFKSYFQFFFPNHKIEWNGWGVTYKKNYGTWLIPNATRGNIILLIIGCVVILFFAIYLYKYYTMNVRTGKLVDAIFSLLLVIIPGASEPSVRTLRATIPENESQPNFLILV